MVNGYDRDDVRVKGVDPTDLTGAGDNITRTIDGDRTMLDVAGKFSLNTHGSAGDAFGRLRVSNSETLWTFMPTSGKHNNTLWNEKLISGGTSTYEEDKNAVKLSVTAASGSKAERATNRRFVYTPFKSQMIGITCNFEGSDPNIIKLVGLGDSKDAFLYKVDGSGISVGVRSNVTGSAVDNFKAQSIWNIDKLDGTGNSGLTLDLTKQQILVFDFQYLGSGRVRFGFDINGKVVYCHEFFHANSLSTVYASTPHLPLFYSIENPAGLGAASDFRATCFAISVEGGDEPFGQIATFSDDLSETTITSTETYLFAARLKLTANRLSAKLVRSQFIMTNGEKPVLIRIYFNPTLTSATFAAGNSDLLEFDMDATAFSGGTLIGKDYLNVGEDTSIAPDRMQQGDIYLGADLDGISDIIVVTAETLSVNSKLLFSSSFREFI